MFKRIALLFLLFISAISTAGGYKTVSMLMLTTRINSESPVGVKELLLIMIHDCQQHCWRLPKARLTPTDTTEKFEIAHEDFLSSLKYIDLINLNRSFCVDDHTVYILGDRTCQGLINMEPGFRPDPDYPFPEVFHPENIAQLLNPALLPPSQDDVFAAFPKPAVALVEFKKLCQWVIDNDIQNTVLFPETKPIPIDAAIAPKTKLEIQHQLLMMISKANLSQPSNCDLISSLMKMTDPAERASWEDRITPEIKADITGLRWAPKLKKLESSPPPSDAVPLPAAVKYPNSPRRRKQRQRRSVRMSLSIEVYECEARASANENILEDLLTLFNRHEDDAFVARLNTQLQVDARHRENPKKQKEIQESRLAHHKALQATACFKLSPSLLGHVEPILDFEAITEKLEASVAPEDQKRLAELLQKVNRSANDQLTNTSQAQRRNTVNEASRFIKSLRSKISEIEQNIEASEREIVRAKKRKELVTLRAQEEETKDALELMNEGTRTSSAYTQGIAPEKTPMCSTLRLLLEGGNLYEASYFIEHARGFETVNAMYQFLKKSHYPKDYIDTAQERRLQLLITPPFTWEVKMEVTEKAKRPSSYKALHQQARKEEETQWHKNVERFIREEKELETIEALLQLISTRPDPEKFKTEALKAKVRIQLDTPTDKALAFIQNVEEPDIIKLVVKHLENGVYDSCCLENARARKVYLEESQQHQQATAEPQHEKKPETSPLSD